MQNENYEILKRGKTAQLKEIAAFVKKQASIRKDLVSVGEAINHLFSAGILRNDITGNNVVLEDV